MDSVDSVATLTEALVAARPEGQHGGGGVPDLSPMRVETALSRFPVHRIAKKGDVRIEIRNQAAAVMWEVSHNSKYGQPGPLAYKLDTLVVNQRLDAVGRPAPRLLSLGSLSEIAARLDLGRNTNAVKRALLQNAFAAINARISYRALDGAERTLEAAFTRYGVVFTGETLPDGGRADAVYLVLSDIYREVLDHAVVRPLDYEYMKALPPSAQRFYEIVSYQVYAALLYGNARARLRYSEFCLLSTQTRYADFEHVKKQMYKVHKPHLDSGYLARAEFERTVDTEGRPDWWMLYEPGPHAEREFAAFRGGAGAVAARPHHRPPGAPRRESLGRATAGETIDAGGRRPARRASPGVRGRAGARPADAPSSPPVSAAADTPALPFEEFAAASAPDASAASDASDASATPVRAGRSAGGDEGASAATGGRAHAAGDPIPAACATAVTAAGHPVAHPPRATGALAEARALLLRAGFDAAAATALCSAPFNGPGQKPCPDDAARAARIARQCAWIDRRKATGNRLGLLRRAIEQDWAEPSGDGPGSQGGGGRRVGAGQDAGGRATGPGEPRTDASEADVADGMEERVRDERERLSAHEPAVWAALLAEAEAALPPPVRRRPDGPAYRPALDARLDALIAERLVRDGGDGGDDAGVGPG